MQLSAEQFQSIIDSTRPLGHRRAGEKRMHARIGVDARVTIIPLDQDARPIALQVGVRDVSRRGISIRHSEPIEVGRQFILCLSAKDGTQTCAVVCVVRRLMPVAGGQFEMGCEFDGEIQPAVPTEQIFKGLKKMQVKLFAADLDAA